MGLRLSLDSSESESNGGPGTTSRMYTTYHQPRDRLRAASSPENIPSGSDSVVPNHELSTSDVSPNVTDSISLRDIVRELRSLNSDESVIYRLFYPQSSHDTTTSSRSGAYRSNPMSNPADPSFPMASRSNETNTSNRQRQRAVPGGSAHPRNRRNNSDLNTDIGAGRPHGGRSGRRSGPVGHWDSSDSDADDIDFVNNLRLSSLLLRHMHSSSGE